MKPILIYQSNNIYKKILYSVGSTKRALKFGQQINISEGEAEVIKPNVEKKLHNCLGEMSQEHTKKFFIKNIIQQKKEYNI